MKRRWFIFFLLRSISQRKGRVVIATASVTLAVAVVTGIFAITLGINKKLGSELKAYGANIIVSAPKGAYLASEAVDQVSRLKGIEEASGQVFGQALLDRQAIEVIGVDFKTLRGRGWRFWGSWPEKQAEAIAGANIKNALRLDPGKKMALSHEGMKMDFTISGFFEKGGSEDSAVIMSLDDAWRLTNSRNRLSAVLVRASAGRLDTVMNSISSILPGADVKTVRQVAVAEESLLRKIQVLMALVTLVVLSASAISVASTMGANVLERREEIGLMKAIGATRKEVGLFYQAEALFIGLAGGISGFIIGFAAAQAVSKGAFDSYIEVPYSLFLLSIVTGIIITLISSLFPIRDALKYNPAVILRGE